MRAGCRILFLMYHGQGHFNPAFTVARKLQQDHEVIFSGSEYFKAHVTHQGFSFYPLKTLPFGTGLEQWINETYKRTPIYFNTLRDRWKDRLYKLREKELKEMIDACQPTHILLDGHQSTDFIVLYNIIKERSISLALLHAMPPSVLESHIPPLNTTVMPDDQVSIKKAHDLIKWKRFTKKVRQYLLYFGMDDDRITKRRVRRNKIPGEYISQRRSFNSFLLKGIPEFILSQKEFDLPDRDLGPLTQFIGAHIDHQRKRAPNSHYELRKEIIEENLKSGGKLIYCSIGTVNSTNDVAMIFFRKVIAAVSDPYTLVISAKLDAKQKEELEKTGRNIFIFDYVPQLEVLKQADVFITHGGLNSIHEAIDAEIPMLVVPMEFHYDCAGNSTRVVYHKIGLRGDATTDSEKDIRTKIEQLLADPQYKNNLRQMKRNNASNDLREFNKFFEKE